MSKIMPKIGDYIQMTYGVFKYGLVCEIPSKLFSEEDIDTFDAYWANSIDGIIEGDNRLRASNKHILRICDYLNSPLWKKLEGINE